MAIKSALIWPDTHFPDADERAVNLCMEIGVYAGVEEVVLLGDFADFYAISQHPKDLDVSSLLKNEIESVNSALDDIQNAFPDSHIAYCEGNHEHRLSKYIRDQARALYGMFDCPSLFLLKERNIEWIPYTAKQAYNVLNSGLYARHEPLGPNSRTTAQRAMVNVAFGHTHRKEKFTVKNLIGEEFVAMSSGMLADINAPCMRYLKTPDQWSLGFEIAHVETETGNLYRVPVEIREDYTAVFNGKVFRG